MDRETSKMCSYYGKNVNVEKELIKRHYEPAIKRMVKENIKLKEINKELSKALHEARHTKYERYIVPEIEDYQKEIKELQDENRMQDHELERLRNLIKGLDNTIENLEEVIKHKDSIIKEVREYCKKEIGNIIAYYDYVDTKDLENIIKILDKVGSDKE